MSYEDLDVGNGPRDYRRHCTARHATYAILGFAIS